MYKIFIIEDDAIVADVYQTKIKAEGYEVEAAYDGETGYQRLKAFKPDLLLLDMRLPGLSGSDLLVLLRHSEEFKNLPIVAFTGADDTEVKESALRGGATKVLSKNELTPEQIVARITTILAALPKAPDAMEMLVQSIAGWTEPLGRVLVVEDDPVILMLVRDVIEEEGYFGVTAANGLEAFKLLEKDSNYVAGIFDIKMPHIQGTDLIRHMHANRRLQNIPVMVMTGDQSLSAQSESYAAGAALFIPKPFTRATLKTMFHQLVERRKSGSELGLPG